MTTAAPAGSVGHLLRQWRERRHLSQLELAARAEVSARHLSFVETGRSKPTPSMILRLAAQLEVPLREQNTLLMSGGYAPAHPEHRLGEPSMALVSDAITTVLEAHEPFPAVVIDQHWDMVAGNRAIERLIAGAAAHLLEPPVNVLRLSLHPDGLAPAIVNLGEWRGHLLERLSREIAASADAGLMALLDELTGYPGADSRTQPDTDAIVVPLRIRFGDAELAMFSMTTVFGTPRDVTVSELAIETFYPADAGSSALLRDLASTAAG
ncbi:helix-turn-helix domain-containing protein [Nakamurella lactea]|uniref:helix-turn-helix domain-containing protein n=1 Tax=Nakamurella lactea TaxID=459515 RepID=UPI00048E3383|nr:helix-turn-helix transcriptional regulator [Nakamurella lactea]